MSNQRLFVRVKRHLIVTHRIKGAGNPFEMTQTLDVSLDGFALNTEKPIKTGTILEMHVQFPFKVGERIALDGYVMSCQEVHIPRKSYRIGVRLKDFDDDLAEGLAGFIERFKE